MHKLHDVEDAMQIFAAENRSESILRSWLLMTERDKARARLRALVITYAEWAENGEKASIYRKERDEARVCVAEMDRAIERQIIDIKQAVRGTRDRAGGEVEAERGVWTWLKVTWSRCWQRGAQ